MSYQGFGKIPRFSREVIITEKLDGTNGQVRIESKTAAGLVHGDVTSTLPTTPLWEDADWAVYAGSRNRWLSTEKNQDNHGFAAWVRDNAPVLTALGHGSHFGEWWGGNIARKYGVPKRFSLFNVEKWAGVQPECCDVVPVINRGVLSDALIEEALDVLRKGGSQAAPGFMDPEGIVIYHTAARSLFKKLLKNDEIAKGEA